MEETTFIYGLECPIFKEIRYIGQSKNPQKRYVNHRRSGNLYISKWFKRLEELCMEPNLIILEEVPIGLSDIKEDEYIEKYSRQNYIFNKNLNKNLKKAKAKIIKQKRKEVNKNLVLYKRTVKPFLNLTKTETMIAQLLIKGFTYNEIMNKLYITYSTLKIHNGHIRNKLNLSTGNNTKDWIFNLIKLYNSVTLNGGY